MERQVITTKTFTKWLQKLSDRQSRRLINSRIAALATGIEGDAKSLGGGLRELRFYVGPGYRIYFANYSDRLVLLLVGGDKDSQSRDIKKARQLKAQWEASNEP